MIHALVLTWNGIAHMRRLHDSIQPILDQTPDMMVWVKDNASTDGTADEVRTWGDRWHLIAHPDNRQNFAEGCNLLFDAAAPQPDDRILLLNNDIVFQDALAITQMNRLLDRKGVGMVGARLCYPGGKTLQHAGVVFTNRFGLPINHRAGEISDDRAVATRLYQSVTGALCLLRADTYQSICHNPSGRRGLDEHYLWAFEDVDAGLHVTHNLHQQVLYCGETDVHHEESATLKRNQINRLFLNRNAQHFLSKWRDRYEIDLPLFSQNPDRGLV